MNVTWKISNVEWIHQLGDNSNVVKNVHYWVQAEDENDNMGYTWGNVQLNTNNIVEFSDLALLTEEKVIGWAKAELDNLYSTTELTGSEVMESAAINMCLEQDPTRRRSVGVPWKHGNCS